MKIGELLRSIADVADEMEDDVATGHAEPEVPAEPVDVEIVDVEPEVQIEPEPVEVDMSTPTDAEATAPEGTATDNGIMVPPLQQKHELLKKATGLNNYSDTFADEEPKSTEEEAIDIIKKLAGIKDEGDPAEMPILSISHDFEPIDD